MTGTPLVPIESFDVVASPEYAAAYAAGLLTMMETKTGFSTILVDADHNIVTHAGLAKRPEVGKAVETVTTGGSGTATAAKGLVTPDTIAGVVAILAAAGAWYFIRKRKRAKVAAEKSSGVESMVLVEAETVVDAELERLRATSLGVSPS